MQSVNIVNESVNQDIAWAIANGVPSEEESLPLLGSWTAFNRETTSVDQNASIVKYMPVIPEPPLYAVCKDYLETLKHIAEELNLDHIFAHADEQVYAQLAQIIWKHGEYYKNVIILMGGFHQLRVAQRLLYKHFGCLGYKEWFIDAGTIASGSADKACEGNHYYRSMRLHKEGFDALVQYRTEQITEKYTKVDTDLLKNLKELRGQPSTAALHAVTCMESFKVLKNDIMAVTGTQSKMTIQYLKDVSNLLALVSAVRENNIEKHLQAERQMLKQVFAFDHQKYARYLSYQHVFLRELQPNGHPAFKDLVNYGYGANLSGQKFASIHGDLVTELYNRETKGTAGPFRSGYSTDIQATNTWVKTTHIHAKLRVAFREKLHLKTSSVHKELTDSGKKRHKRNVDSLKLKLHSYQVNPFEEGHARTMTTGAEIDCNVVKGLIDATDRGNHRYTEFIEECLVSGNKSIFDPIKKETLLTGMEKKKKVAKALSLLKEDRQAFGLLVAKAISIEEAFRFPVKTLPLSLATPEGQLRQSDKAVLRNFLACESNALTTECPTDAVWLIDRMAAFRSLKPKSTYAEWFLHVLKSVTPSCDARPKKIALINDTYRPDSIKAGTRETRGASSRRVYLQGFNQMQLQGREWQEFFNNIKNKEDLIHLAATFFKSEDAKAKLTLPLVLTDREKTWLIENNVSKPMFDCNHEEADTRLALQASLEESTTVVVAKDTDVLILLLYGHLKTNPKHQWFMKIDHEQFINIAKVRHHIGDEICEILPQVHAITGCDSTSYMFNVGKVRVLKQIIRNPEVIEVIKGIGEKATLSDEMLEDAKKFIQTVMYAGKVNESYVDTRVRLYKGMKQKIFSQFAT